MSKSMVESKVPETRIGRESPSPRISSKPPTLLKPRVTTTVNRASSIPDPTTFPGAKVTSEPSIIEKIRKERQELIKRGVSVRDPMILEIDKRIKNYRPITVKRI